MRRKLMVALGVLALSAFAAGCNDNSTSNTANVNTANVNTSIVVTSTPITTTGQEISTAPDNSEISTETSNGVVTQTRTFRDPNSRVERVVVTTRDGRRTARVYYRDRSVRELPDSGVERALDATGDALVTAGGKVVDVSKDVGSAVGEKTVEGYDKAKDIGGAVGDKTVEGAKAVGHGAKTTGEVTADKSVEVGEKTVDGAKKVGKATADGAKKTGKAIKGALTP